jgi:hypothetical protein
VSRRRVRGHVVPATAGKFPELQVRRVPVLRSYFRLGRDRAARHFLGLLGLARVRRFLGLAESGPEGRLRFRTGVRDLVDVGG